MSNYRILAEPEAFLKRLLSPPAFFFGVLAGFAACCLGGRQLAKFTNFHDFRRFHRFIDPEGLYYPTALQVRTLARSLLPRDKIAVVVGGSSVMLGIGQSADELWTRRLQEQLGDDYRVLNLAMVGGTPNGYSQLASEMLLRDHARIIHVCDAHLNYQFAPYPDGARSTYRYFFHDARARGLLQPFPERDQALAALEPERRAREGFGEMALQTRVNGWLSFNDLWHVFGYRYCFTVWTALAHEHPWQPRAAWPDRALTAEHIKAFQSQVQVYRTMVRRAARPLADADWRHYESVVQQSVPEVLRPKTLVVVNRFNPARVHSVEQELPGTRAQFDRNLRELVDRYHSYGLEAVEGCVTLADGDFMDCHHLLASGGAKLADELAPVIRTMAQRLGYLAGEPR